MNVMIFLSINFKSLLIKKNNKKKNQVFETLENLSLL